MFRSADSFNQDIGLWDVSNVSEMDFMFCYAESFNQVLSKWCVEIIPNEPYCFSDNSQLPPNHHPHWGVECQVGIDQITALKVFIHPNPAVEELCITTQNGLIIDKVIIYNQLGRIELQSKVINNKVDIYTLETGLYIIEIVSNDFLSRQKLIIK